MKSSQWLIALFFLLFQTSLKAQMWNGTDSLYGNEWIRYDQTYFKILIPADGIYRIPYQAMANTGIPVESIAAGRFQLFHLGEEVPLFVTNNGVLTPGDYIEFYARRNRTELDRFMYKNPDTELLNPYISLVSDTAAYFLTWGPVGTEGLRFENTTTDLNNPPPKEEWCWVEERTAFNNRYNQRAYKFDEDISESVYDEGEGYASVFFNENTITFSPKFPYPASEKARFEVQLLGSRDQGHQLELSLNNAPQVNQNFTGFKLLSLSFEKNADAILAAEVIKAKGLAGSADSYCWGYARLSYPRQWNADNKKTFDCRLKVNGNVQYIELNQFNSENASPVVYDLQNRVRTTAVLNNGLVLFTLPPATDERILSIANQVSGFQNVTSLQPVTFVDYSQANAAFLIISHAHFFDDGQGNNWVNAYAEYRQSPEGGNMQSLAVDVQQLYDQFAYGINRHPLAIRNCIQFGAKYWHPFKYVFLIGKGRESTSIRSAANLAAAANFYVPTWGTPGSDNLLAARHDNLAPIVPIGRLAAVNPSQVKWYLDKVIADENPLAQSESDRAWRKEVIHLGGGGSASEQQTIRQYLDQLEQEIETNSYGGNVHSFYKTSSDPIQQAQSEELTGRINSGAGIITFFGHSGTGGFDFSIDNPATYQNQGKYPIVISLGCLSGQIHTNTISVGEQFILQENKGAMAFFATVGYGFISSLNTINQEFYRRVGGADYGKGIGDALRSTIDKYKNNGFIGTRALTQQYTLNGDPAVKIAPYPAPDYLVPAVDVKFIPEVINAQQDSFQLSFGVKNIGKAIPDSIWVSISRQTPNGIAAEVARFKMPSPRYQSDFSIKMPVLGENAIGINRIFITADDDDLVAEWPSPQAEMNNQLVDGLGIAGLDFYVFSNSVTPIDPPHFGIVGHSPVTLTASTSNTLAETQRYIIEIDTTAYFNSPFKQRKAIEQTGGLLSWNPEMAWQDSMVYYWRVSPDTTTQPNFTWRTASFVYLDGIQPGWWQSHVYQYREDRFHNMEIPETTRRFKYLDDLKTIKVWNRVISNSIDFPGVSVNNLPFGFLNYDGPVRQGLYIFVFDSLTVDPWINTAPGLYDSHMATTWAYWGHFPYFTTSQEWRQKAIHFLEDIIPSGDYVLMYTAQTATADYKPEEWAADSIALGTNLFQVLERQGAHEIRSTATEGARPYVFFYKKDHPEYPILEHLSDSADYFETTLYVEGIWDSGDVTTEKIGPALQWHSLRWQMDEVELQDEQSIDVYGVRSDSTFALLASGLTSEDTTLSWINAEEYPYLRLRFNSADTLLRTSPQLRFWQVGYAGVPEAALAPNLTFDFQSDTLQQGRPLSMRMAAQNISDWGMDSLLFKFSIIGEDNALAQSWQKRVSPLPAGDTLVVHTAADTKILSGHHRLLIDMNPDNDQPERSHLNNVAIKDFYVTEDMRNPLLDVTFDGIHILDGDLVSARPQIVIRLDDENQFLLLDDTASFKVLLQRPGMPDVTPIGFNTGELQFYPATSGNNNKATVEWTPELLEDGKYALIVQARDITGNVSGRLDYRIHFKVITEARISNILNYPNPFSTATQFVYTLTGAEPPAYFSIQIMTVSGRVVRTLTQNELGPLHIGTHRTEYTWDGTDDFGDKLANGVYLYRVIARDSNGKDYQHFETGADPFFKNDFGKLVILR